MEPSPFHMLAHETSKLPVLLDAGASTPITPNESSAFDSFFLPLDHLDASPSAEDLLEDDLLLNPGQCNAALKRKPASKLQNLLSIDTSGELLQDANNSELLLSDLAELELPGGSMRQQHPMQDSRTATLPAVTRGAQAPWSNQPMNNVVAAAPTTLAPINSCYEGVFPQTALPGPCAVMPWTPAQQGVQLGVAGQLGQVLLPDYSSFVPLSDVLAAQPSQLQGAGVKSWRSVLAGHGSCVLWRTCAPPKACSLRSIDAQSRPLLIALAQRDSCSPLACACSVPVAPFAPTGCAFCQGCKAGPAPSGASSMASSQHAELGSIPKVASTGTFLGMDTSHPRAAGSDVVHATGALPGAGPPYPCKEGEATEKLREVRKGRRVKGIAKAKAAMLDTGDVTKYNVPHVQFLTPPHLRRGKGGRQPAPDPTTDPNIDPKRARRIMANRLSAARSKLKQKRREQTAFEVIKDF